MTPDVAWTSVFADGPGGGNPCAVTFAAEALTGAEMQEAAAGFGVESAFVLPPDGEDADVRLRFFVPRHEMEMCVHATVGATVLLAERGALPAGRAARVQTPLGVREVEHDAAARTAAVVLPGPELGPPLTELDPLLAALGITAVAGVVRSASAARAKLLVPLPDEATVDALAPDHAALWDACDTLDVTGVYAYTCEAAGADIAARQFPVRAGYDEDPATGVAAAALAGALAAEGVGRDGEGWRAWRVAQGRALGQPSIMDAAARVDARGAVVATRVAGTASPAR